MNGVFREIWTSLNATERDVAIALSAVYEERSVLDLSRLLNKIGLQPPVGEPRFTHAATEQIVHKLHESKLVDRHDDRTWRIAAAHSESIMRLASRRPDFSYLLNEIRRELPYKTYWQPSSPRALMREIRIEFYLQHESNFERLQREAETFYPDQVRAGTFIQPLFGDFDPRWVETLLPAWQEISVRNAFRRALLRLEPLGPLVEFLEQYENIRGPKAGPLRDLLIEAFVLQGAWSRLQLWADLETDEWRQAANHLIYHVLRDDDDGAQALIETVRKGYALSNDGKYPAHLAGYLYLLSLLRSGGVKSAEGIGQHLDNVEPTQNLRLGGTFLVLRSLFAYLRNDETAQYIADQGLARVDNNAFTITFQALYRMWTDSSTAPVDEAYLEELDRLRDRAQTNGYRWVEMELTRVLATRHPLEAARTAFAQRAGTLSEELRIISLADAMPRIEPWERALEVLATMGAPDQRAEKKAKKTARFVWFVDFEKKELEPREQTLSKGGAWSKGRKVALKRVKHGEVEGMTPQDVSVAQTIDEDFSKYHPNGHYEIRYEDALMALVGHPHLYLLENASISVDLVRRNPQLLIEEGETRLYLRFAQEFKGTGVQVVKETPTRYQLIEVNEAHDNIHRQIGSGLEIPKRARHRLQEVSRNLSKIVEVQSTLNGVIDDVDEAKADQRTYVHLLPVGDTFKLEFFVKPLPDEDQYFKPGRGRHKVIGEKDGQRRLAERNLAREIELAEGLILECPTLQQIIHRDYEWQVDEVEHCLSILLELQPLKALNRIVLEHPRGERIRLVGSVDFGDLSLGVKEKAGWFDVEGELAVDDHQVINFRELMEKIGDNDQSKFIQLSEGQYVALTENLRRKLREMEGLLSPGENGLQLHPLAAGILDDVADQLASFEADVSWRESLNRIQSVGQNLARVPSTFRAELRPYQLDGFRWLMRLADWGVGACLADDMGLGKTIQALAMLQARAETGPALVIAPASVTRNWVREAAKFAPTLNPVLLGTGDRQEIIESVGPWDMLVVSYGLLPFEGEALAAKHFGTIILDEAQAIKNRGTKRSQVAMSLQADLRVATTGTPIENHLGELWNLFQFLNPGLLGSFQRFNEKYTVPITKNNDNERRQQLRRLIQPFILRRRKEEVLEELPPKTEVTLTVELSPAERAFYEALRQRALEQIDESDGPNRRFQILAQLMKLRQAACHPQMVDASVNIGSSKLELLAETIVELRASGHKALIFSQFVRHLKLVEEWVISQGIPYQYLDGSTPGAKREEAVQAFQRGEGDVFLISLKAGGTGLTLTAADYVIHLDPWWNPAVEDQASDRAHRIGQQRPVTVYRFVSENTIEEKIVQLHNEKRDLADSLLAGTEQSASLTAEDLLDLIKFG
ncbi:DEAD/DEAH box helicase [Neolewinella lacunae]|uniref:DEAD/DEAH box helicase n=1 Tax=Neolewinella lacunae TaxID=1517758 RepID=A0A923TET5_9BACT|nr:DEAD/DEAH box helicase [Neolewinella lacunae]MBC6996267.1 DEAD/DEAH box helicase [Neolewinella lacunae]MDN3636890.1 DEAD/DEAH box helicase [Neolewinella lacunae]